MELKIRLLIIILNFSHLLLTQGQDIDESEKCCNFRIYQSQKSTDRSVQYKGAIKEYREAARYIGENGLEGFSWLCIVKGIFIFYKGPDFVAEKPSDVKLYSGLAKCSVPALLGFGSIRLGASQFWDPEIISYITVFSNLYYSGAVMISVRDHEAIRIKGQGIRSFLTVGPDKWSVTTESGKQLCIVPESDPEKTLVCVVPDASELLGNDPLDLVWTTIDRGDDCSGGQEIALKSCFDYENGEIQDAAVNPIAANEQDGNSTTMTLTDFVQSGGLAGGGIGTIHSPFGEDTSCDTYDEAAFLIRMRVTHNFLDVYQFLLPLNKEHAWRTELLDTTFDIITDTGFIPGEIPVTPVLRQIREYFVYVIEKLVWSQGNGWPKKPTNELMDVVHEARECVGRVRSDETLISNFHLLVSESFGSLASIRKLKEIISEDFRHLSKLDPLMEFVWLVFNTAAVVCHQAKGFDSNFWIDYHVVLKEMYLDPLSEHWLRQNEIHRIYPLILGGEGIRLQYNLLAACVTALLNEIPFLDIIARPKEVIDFIESLPKSK